MQTSSRKHDWISFVLLALIISTSVIWSLTRVGLWQAPGLDEGHYVGVGARVAAGQLLYVDFYEGVQKPPLMYWTCAMAVKLLGNQASVFPFLRALSILLKVASVLLIFSIGQMAASRRLGLVAATLFSFHALVGWIGNQVRGEPYSTFFALLGLWVCLRAERLSQARDAGPDLLRGGRRDWQAWGYFAAGFFITVGILYRPTPLLLALPLGIALLTGKDRWKHKLRALGMVVAGGLLALMPFVVYLAVNQAFKNFYVMMFRFMSAFPLVPHSLHHRLKYLKLSFLTPQGSRWLITLALVTGVIHAVRRQSRVWLTVASWFCLQMVVVFTLRREEWHYHYEFLPAFVLLLALGFERLLASAKMLYTNAEAGSRAHWLLAEGNLIRLIATILLPLAILVVFHDLQWAATEWKAGLNPLHQLARGIWPAAAALLAGSLLVIWTPSAHNYYLFLVTLGISAAVLLSSPRGDKVWQLTSAAGVSLCFIFALSGWIWRWVRLARRRVLRLPGGWLATMATQILSHGNNPVVIILWLLMLWLPLTQADVLVKHGPPRFRLRDTERTAEYLQAHLEERSEVLSSSGEIAFLLGQRFPTYWGKDHEQVAADLGIAEMVGRELADVARYCEKHRVQFIVFGWGLHPGLMGSEGASYIRRHFEQDRCIGPYGIYRRKYPDTSNLDDSVGFELGGEKASDGMYGSDR